MVEVGSLAVSEAISAIVKSSAAEIAPKSVSFGRKKLGEFKVDFESCFTQYLGRSYERYSKVKTLVHGDRPVDLKSIFVETEYTKEPFSGAKSGGRPGHGIYSFLVRAKRTVVFGTAGSGKSVLLRKLFVDMIENGSAYIPILIELRMLSGVSRSSSLEEFIYEQVALVQQNFTIDQMSYALRIGKFFIMMDGYDEISPERRSAIERDILQLTYQYGKSIFVVTSRLDEKIRYWEEFKNVRTLPLNQDQAVELIKRIDYDQEPKEKFCRKLSDGFFGEQQEFLSNPLLLTIMFLTYESMAEIPDSMHNFYDQAFLTLYHRHDATKQIFKRELYAKLPVDWFRRIFRAFCAITYCNSQIRFERGELIGRLEQSIDLENRDLVNPKPIGAEDYLNDLVESVCLLQADGSEYTFSHRSFQEFFTAEYISSLRTVDPFEIIEKVARSSRSDNVLNILFEINNELIERSWVIPKIAKMLKEADRLSRLGATNQVAALFVEEVVAHKGPHLAKGSGKSREYGDFQFEEGPWMNFLYFAIPKYVYVPSRMVISSRANVIRLGEITHERFSVACNAGGRISVADLDSSCPFMRAVFPNRDIEARLNFLSNVNEYLENKYANRGDDIAELFSIS